MKKLASILISFLFVTGCYTRIERPVHDGEPMTDENELEIVEVVYPVTPPQPPVAPPFQPPVKIRPIFPAPAPTPPAIEKDRTNDNERKRAVKDKGQNLRNNTGERSSQSGRKR